MTHLVHGRRRTAGRSLAFFILLAVALAACGGSSGSSGSSAPPPPELQSLTIGSGQAYASVGAPQRLSVTGHYSDGSTAELTTGLTWATSSDAVATVDGDGVVTPWDKGGVQITATHAPSGLSARTTLTSRVIVALRAATALPAGENVDRSIAYFHVSGLEPGTMVLPKVSYMTDDVDLAVYGDESMTDASLLCESDNVGKQDDGCVAPASARGDLWIAVTGEWTQRGAWFSLDVQKAAPVPLAGELAYPAALPYAGSVGSAKQFWKVTGLTPGQSYEFRIANLTADVDLEVYGDRYEYRTLCSSYLDGTAEDACTAAAGSAGELIVELDGTTSLAGGSYTLSVTAK